MPSCFVCGRTENTNSKSENISFHRFPTKECIRKKWYNFLVENYLNPENVTKNSLVCSSHFEKSCFIMKQTRKLLLRHAFPSIVVGRIKSAKILYTETTKTINVPQEIEEDAILHFDRTLVKISTTSDEELVVIPLDEPSTLSNVDKSDIQNNNILNIEEEIVSINEPSTSSYEICEQFSDKLDENKMNKRQLSLIDASEVTIEDLPHHIYLKHCIRQLSQDMLIKNKKLKILQQTIRRKNKQISDMQTIINNVKN